MSRLPRISKNNYYSSEINKVYWSASLVKQFLACPASALAELNGTYQRPYSSALAIGSYVDAAVEGKKSFDRYVDEHHEEIFLKGKELKFRADYERANLMIDRMKSDDVFMDYLKGQKQKILTGKLFGLPFKAKLDVYKKGERIVDLKTVKDMDWLYKPGVGKISPIEYYGWDIQMAIYSALEGHDLPTYLAIVTKETSPELFLIEIDKERRESCLAFLEDKMPYFDGIKQGIIPPDRCDTCDYCKATKKITRPITMEQLRLMRE